MQEDVYESEDLPESDQITKIQGAETFDSEHVHSVHLDVGAAFQRFKGKTLDSEGVDFSDSLAHRRRNGYGAGPYLLEYVGPGFGEPETPMQRFNRLHHEINELSKDIDDIKNSGGGDESSVSQADMGALQQQLKQLQVEQILGDSAKIDITDPDAVLARKVENALKAAKKSVASGKEKKDEKGAAGSGDKKQAIYELNVIPVGPKESKAVELESRLAKLESILGADTEKLLALTGGRGGGVMEATQALHHKLQLLDATHIDAVDSKLAVLLHKLSQVAEKEELIEAEDSEKMGELHELMSKWDGVCSTLPQLVARLHALHDLHEQALQFSQCLTQIDGVQQQLVKSLESDRSLLNDVKSGLEENAAAIKKNCDSLNERLKKQTK